MPLPILPVFALVLAAGLLAGCSPLTAFANLTPTDPSRKVAEAVSYGADPRQKLDIYRPPKTAAVGAAPLAVFFYGGSWRDGRRQDYGWVGRALASEGFVTLVPDYRLYPEVTYPDFLEDSAAAVAWAVNHADELGADGRRVVLIGHSAGAYNALMLGLDPAYLRAEGVDPATVRAMAGLAGPYDFLPLTGSITPPVFGGATDLEATQPINQVRPGAPAAFLAAGADDSVVEPADTRALAQALEREGVTVRTAIYPDIGHAGILLALSLPLRGRAPVLQDMTAFLHDQLDSSGQVAVRQTREALPDQGSQ